VNPDADEVCGDAVDNNCNGAVDDADPTVVDSTTWYADADADGYGNVVYALDACEMPTGYTDVETDCDDANDQVYPTAPEECTGIDNDCDGSLSLDACASCSDILANNSSATDGIYTIDLDGDAGPTAPFDVHCDMTIDGGGWTRFWWFEAGSSFGAQTDMLGQDTWECDPAVDTTCLGRIPGVPVEFMVTNQDADWAVWAFNGNNTSNHIYNAFVNHTAVGNSCGSAFNAVADSGMNDDPYRCDEMTGGAADNCDCFYYKSQGGLMSFYLDDDTGWAETAFGAGNDGSGVGVDSLETGGYRDHDFGHSMWIAWR